MRIKGKHSIHSIGTYGREEELQQSLEFLTSTSKNKLLIIYADRFEGSSSFIKKLHAVYFKEKCVHLSWRQQNCCLINKAYNELLIKQLMTSGKKEWGKLYDALDLLDLIGDRKVILRKWKWIKNNLRKIKSSQNYISNCRTHLNLLSPDKPLFIDQLDFIATSFFDCATLFFFIEDYLLYSNSKNHNLKCNQLIDYVSFKSKESLTTNIVISLLANKNNAQFIIDLLQLKEKTIDIKTIELHPLRISYNKNPLKFWEATPIIPGIVDPLAPKNHSKNYFKIISNEYYSSINLNEFPSTDPELMVLVSVIWMFGQVFEHDIFNLANLLKVNIKKYLSLLKYNQFFRIYINSWTFIDAWRAFVIAKTLKLNVCFFANDFLSAIILNKNFNKNDYLFLWRLDINCKKSWGFKISSYYLSSLTSCRSYHKNKSKKSIAGYIEAAEKLNSHFLKFNAKTSIMQHKACLKLFDETQNLNILDYILDCINTENAMDNYIEYIVAALKNSKKYCDLTLFNSSYALLKKNLDFLEWNFDLVELIGETALCVCSDYEIEKIVTTMFQNRLTDDELLQIFSTLYSTSIDQQNWKIAEKLLIHLTKIEKVIDIRNEIAKFQPFINKGIINVGNIIKDNVNSTIITDSIVTKSFNKLKDDLPKETVNTLLLIQEKINESNNDNAKDLFNCFNEEIQKRKPKKSILAAFWDGMLKILPDLGKFSKNMAKILSIFN